MKSRTSRTHECCEVCPPRAWLSEALTRNVWEFPFFALVCFMNCLCPAPHPHLNSQLSDLFLSDFPHILFTSYCTLWPQLFPVSSFTSPATLCPMGLFESVLLLTWALFPEHCFSVYCQPPFSFPTLLPLIVLTSRLLCL